MVDWCWKRFGELSALELYEICRVRSEIFVIEQNCVYNDLDGLDHKSWHLCAWKNDLPTPQLLAYLRLLPPHEKYSEASIGRVLTSKHGRGLGLGKSLIRRGIEFSAAEYPTLGIKISAQCYLEEFYKNVGFKAISAPYIDDDIPHIDMILRN